MRGYKKKAGHLGSLFFMSKKTPAQSLRECSFINLRMKKKHASNPSAKVRKIYFITKFSCKKTRFCKLDFTK